MGLGLNKNKYNSVIRDEFRYVLDSKDDYISDFPGETFRVLKEKEGNEFGEYRTRCFVLEAWAP